MLFELYTTLAIVVEVWIRIATKWPWLQYFCVSNIILSFQVPEGNETLTVQLTSASGDGRLGTGPLTQSSLTVLHNDDPVSFAQSVVMANEGERAVLTVNRGGQANGE